MKIPDSEYTISALIDKHQESIQGEIAQGKAHANVYAASEVLANPEACAKGVVAEFREKFNARVVG